MKLATYNVNGINGRLPVLLRWLEGSEPDVVCLQEPKAPDEKFPEAAIEKAGYGAIWHGQKSWNGVAMLARGSKPEAGNLSRSSRPGRTQGKSAAPSRRGPLSRQASRQCVLARNKTTQALIGGAHETVT